jgi:hypothetical protein
MLARQQHRLIVLVLAGMGLQHTNPAATTGMTSKGKDKTQSKQKLSCIQLDTSWIHAG